MKTSIPPQQHTAPRKSDICRCTCYANGVIAVLLAHVLLLAGFILSTCVMMGCDFVVADIGNATSDEYIYNSTATSSLFFNGSETTTTEQTQRRRGFGFFNHQDANGLCHFENMGNDYQYMMYDDHSGTVVMDYTVDYLDWLGPDWETPRNVGLAAVSMSFLLWIWLLLFACVSHPRPLRYILSALIILVMSLQFGTFSLMESEFCQERNCEISRASKLSIAAGMMFLFSGLLLLCGTKNYPGTIEASGQQDEATHVEEVIPAEQGLPYSYQPSRETVEASNMSTPRVY